MNCNKRWAKCWQKAQWASFKAGKDPGDEGHGRRWVGDAGRWVADLLFR